MQGAREPIPDLARDQQIAAETEAPGTALAPRVPRRVEGPRAEAWERQSGMGAGGTASRALAWASLPLLGPPSRARGADLLCGRGKAGRAGRCTRFARTPAGGGQSGGLDPEDSAGLNRSSPDVLCKLTLVCRRRRPSTGSKKSVCTLLASVFLSEKWNNQLSSFNICCVCKKS